MKHTITKSIISLAITSAVTGLAIMQILTSAYAQAVTQTPTSKISVTPTASNAATPTIDPQLDQLKARIASKVAELKLVDKRGFIGQVTDVSDTQITVSDMNSDTRYIDVDELTQFTSASQKNFGISDITKGTEISVIGLYNRESKRMLARFVETIKPVIVIHGAIGAIDKANFQITIVDNNNKKVTVDIQNITKTNSYTKSNGIAKSGFSKLTLRDRITVVGTQEANSGISALRIIDFTDIPYNPVIKQQLLDSLSTITPTVATSPTTTPSTKAK